jgi:hypothetical protein
MTPDEEARLEQIEATVKELTKLVRELYHCVSGRSPEREPQLRLVEAREDA